MDNKSSQMRSLALTPTWSVATVLTVFVVVSLLVERSIHRLSNWLRKTKRKPLLAAVEKMKEELMLLGFISLLLTATSSLIANICIPSKFYDSNFAPCSRRQIDEEIEQNSPGERKLLMLHTYTHALRRRLNSFEQNTCKEGYEPFVSYQGLEQLHRFIFVMAITHIAYSCLTMLLEIVKIPAEGGRPTVTVSIKNRYGDGTVLNIHCKSGNNDLGPHATPGGSDYVFFI